MSSHTFCLSFYSVESWENNDTWVLVFKFLSDRRPMDLELLHLLGCLLPHDPYLPLCHHWNAQTRPRWFNLTGQVYVLWRFAPKRSSLQKLGSHRGTRLGRVRLLGQDRHSDSKQDGVQECVDQWSDIWTPNSEWRIADRHVSDECRSNQRHDKS